MENQEPNEDHSRKDPRPEVGSSVYRSHHSVVSDPDEAPRRSLNELFPLGLRSSNEDHVEARYFHNSSEEPFKNNIL